MKKLMSAAGLASLLLSGCAVPSPQAPASSTPSAANLSLEGQSRVLRSKIVQLKQEVRVFEGMLTDVERRAAMSQISLSSLPNTEVLPGTDAAPAGISNADRLSVTVRPAPESPPLVLPAAPIPKGSQR